MSTTDPPLAATLRPLRRPPFRARVEVELANRSATRWVVHARGRLRMVARPGGAEVDCCTFVLDESSPAFVLDPGASRRWPVDLWRCDRLERRPWRWLFADAPACWSLARGQHADRVWYEIPALDPGSILRPSLESAAANRNARVWVDPVVSNRVRVRI